VGLNIDQKRIFQLISQGKMIPAEKYQQLVQSTTNEVGHYSEYMHMKRRGISL